jgi:hypothetical protein
MKSRRPKHHDLLAVDLHVGHENLGLHAARFLEPYPLEDLVRRTGHHTAHGGVVSLPHSAKHGVRLAGSCLAVRKNARIATVQERNHEALNRRQVNVDLLRLLPEDRIECKGAKPRSGRAHEHAPCDSGVNSQHARMHALRKACALRIRARLFIKVFFRKRYFPCVSFPVCIIHIFILRIFV